MSEEKRDVYIVDTEDFGMSLVKFGGGFAFKTADGAYRPVSTTDALLWLVLGKLESIEHKVMSDE